MDEENKFVDVCGDYIDEENKENCPNFILKSRIKIKEEKREEDKDFKQFGSEKIINKNKKLNELEPTTILRRGPSRKEKSLGKLCNPFLQKVSLEAEHGRDVHLESIARSMNVEKRRIYDIVNVMEALEVMQKTNKSFYKWHGVYKLPELMFALQRDAQKGELPIKIASVERAMCSFTTHFDNENIRNKETNKIIEDLQEDEEESAFGPLTSRDRCGKNSLAQLCRRFLMVLLCDPYRAFSLDVVSTMLIKDLESEGCNPPSRSRCRRLYDIANVLMTMNLVLRTNHLFGTKKIPLYRYCGPAPEEEPTNAALSMHEFLSRERTRICFAGVSLLHPSVHSPDVGSSINSPKYLGDLQNDFKEEKQVSEKKRFSRKVKIEVEKYNENNNLIPTLSSEETKSSINSNKRRKMNRVISQQQQENREDENFSLPRPLPLHPSNVSLPQQLVLCSKENITIPQQQQMFLLPTFPCSSSNFYCWPTQQQLQNQTQNLKHLHQNQTQLQNLKQQVLQNQLQTFPLQSQLQTQILTALTADKYPTKNLTKVRHSVQSILGFTQNYQKGKKIVLIKKNFFLIENISPNKDKSGQQQKEQQIIPPFSPSSSSLSPRAFRPLNQQQKIKKENNENINLFKMQKNIFEGEEKSNNNNTTTKKRVPFGQRQL